MPPTTQPRPSARPTVSALTYGPLHHFFGYYDKTPWDPGNRYVLALEVPFMDRAPGPDDSATVGIIDTGDDNRFLPIDQTATWNWQQGAMLQWLPTPAQTATAQDQPDAPAQAGTPQAQAPAAAQQPCFIYNRREADRVVSVIRQADGTLVRTLESSIYSVDPQGRYALTVNFARLGRLRPGYGYAGLTDRRATRRHPDDDGIWRIDLQTGATELIVSLDQVRQLDPVSSMKRARHWFNHVQINPSGSRFAVLHRWSGSEGRRIDRLLTMDPDGTDLHVVTPQGYCSHYDWYDTNHLLAWTSHDVIGRRFFLFTDKASSSQIIGDGVLDCDGHCSFGPHRRWLLTDTYPDDAARRHLILYRWPNGPVLRIGEFHSPPELTVETRCDLHPRWDRTGQYICVDSAHEGSRQMYRIDLAPVLEA